MDQVRKTLFGFPHPKMREAKKLSVKKIASRPLAVREI
jgi:hypothetical protein